MIRTEWKTNRGDRLFWGLFAAALIAHLLPCWLVQTLPLGDYYGHIELMDIVARYHDPTTVYAASYELPDNWLHPNSISLLAAKWFGSYAGVETIARLLLSFYIVGFPLGLMAVARAFGRSRWLAFFGFILLYSSIMNAGFLNYLVATPILLWSIAQVRRYAEGGGLLLGAGLATTLFLLFFAHVLAYLIGIGITIATIGLFAGRPRHLTRLAVVLPSLFPFGYWVDRILIHPAAIDTGRSMVSEEGLGMIFFGMRQLLHEAVVWGPRYFRDPSDDIALAIALACWGVLYIGGRRGSLPPAHGLRARARRSWLEIVAVLSLVAFFVLPAHITEVDVVGLRVIMLAWTLAAICPRADFGQLYARRVGLVMATLSLAYAAVVYLEFRHWEETEVGDLREVIAELPDRNRLGFVRWHPFEEVTFKGTSWHLAKAFNTLENGGITDDSFAMRPSSPIQIRASAAISKLSFNFYSDPNLLSYDHVMVRTRFPPTNALSSRHLRLRYSNTRFWLFDVLQEPIPRPIIPRP